MSTVLCSCVCNKQQEHQHQGTCDECEMIGWQNLYRHEKMKPASVKTFSAPVHQEVKFSEE
ncbi:MAG TPA: hypothetical protein VIY48_21390 [Candidatus Paceibacterota bacterium]